MIHKNPVPTPRRSFLKRSAALAGGAFFGVATQQILNAHAARSLSPARGERGASPMRSGYGPLKPTPDQNGKVVLALPDGFHYTSFGVLGAEILGSGGLVHPRNHDGMGAFAGPGGTVRLIRNHEVRNAPADAKFAVPGPGALRYDDSPGVGGTVTLDYDPMKRRVVREFVSLSGTIVNCSGGLAYHDRGWITCEETTAGPLGGWKRKHGYAFLVPVNADDTVMAEPILGMGRFAKEAAVADNATGVVYITEDAGNNSGFYRFVPNDPANLHGGGVLQILAIGNSPQYDTRTAQTSDVALRAEWITVPNPDPNLDDPDPARRDKTVFAQGFELGAARFNRLEGIFRAGGGSMVFVSTSGGNARYGQLWRYAPTSDSNGTLTLLFESPSGSVLDSPDNLCVTPAGGILFCEDDASGDRDGHPLAPGIEDVNRLVGLTRDGAPFEFAVNVLNDSEFAGACFSPDGRILFVNVFGDGTPGSGMTCAITGPWERGPL